MHRRLALAASLAVMLPLLANSASALDPSFPCDRHLNAVEYKICSTPVLAEHDRALAVLYETVKARIRPRSDVDGLVADQKRWLARRDRCWTRHCIARSYTQRIDTLRYYAVLRDD